LADPNVEGKILLKRILNMTDPMKTETGFIWHRKEITGDIISKWI
jgi:hypothetical protein